MLSLFHRFKETPSLHSNDSLVPTDLLMTLQTSDPWTAIETSHRLMGRALSVTLLYCRLSFKPVIWVCLGLLLNLPLNIRTLNLVPYPELCSFVMVYATSTLLWFIRRVIRISGFDLPSRSLCLPHLDLDGSDFWSNWLCFVSSPCSDNFVLTYLHHAT